MTLKTNATMVFMDYQVQDTGVQLHFVCPDPGGGEASDYYIFVTDSEIAGITNLSTAKTLITTKLGRRLRATGLATKLDLLIGQSMVV